jgi:hypothetical protein
MRLPRSRPELSLRRSRRISWRFDAEKLVLEGGQAVVDEIAPEQVSKLVGRGTTALIGTRYYRGVLYSRCS